MPIANETANAHKAATEAFYITLLRGEFTRRKVKNRAYSLNAFAKHLEIDQSLFSKILSGKKKISDRMASGLLLRAGLTPDKINSALGGFTEVSEQEFSFLSDWIPFAILELAKTTGFKCETKWLASRLGVHAEEITSALSRLERFGYIAFEAKTKKFKLQRPDNNWSNTKQTTLARRLLQKKFSEMSLSAIDNVAFELRDHGSLTLAIDKKRLPEIKERLNNFRMELGKLLQKDEKLNEVYQITMSVFPLTKPGDKL